MTTTIDKGRENPLDYKGLGVGMNEQKVIINYIPVERSLCITIEELKSLIDYFPFGHPHRVAFEMLAFTGCRGMALHNITLSSFTPDCERVRIPEVKNRPKYTWKGTTVWNIKCVDRDLPPSYSKELMYYIENNHHMFKDGRIFPFCSDTLRRYWNKLRVRCKDGRIVNHILCNMLLDEAGERHGFGVCVNNKYRVSLHSFRRFYETYVYHTKFDNDLSRLVRHMGYNKKDTALTYLYHPEQIGLTPSLKAKRLTFEALFFNEGQQTLTNFNNNPQQG